MDTCQCVLDIPIDTAPLGKRKTSKYKLLPNLKWPQHQVISIILVVFLAKQYHNTMWLFYLKTFKTSKIRGSHTESVY